MVSKFFLIRDILCLLTVPNQCALNNYRLGVCLTWKRNMFKAKKTNSNVIDESNHHCLWLCYHHHKPLCALPLLKNTAGDVGEAGESYHYRGCSLHIYHTGQPVQISTFIVGLVYSWLKITSALQLSVTVSHLLSKLNCFWINRVFHVCWCERWIYDHRIHTKWHVYPPFLVHFQTCW